MDFHDEPDFGMEESQGSASTFLSHSQSSASRVSRRGLAGSKTRVRPRPSSNKNPGNDDDYSVGSTSASVVVRGAGTSAWMVQDAGTVQMLKDECSYLCSALLVSKSPHQTLTTALELAQLLESRKSRNILWQSCMNARTDTTSPNTTTTVRSNLDVATSTETTPKTNRTILDAILDVIACIATGRTVSKADKEMTTDTHSTAYKSLPGSPSRSVRTKSARRKLKQQEQIQQHLGSQDSQQLDLKWWASPQHATILPQLWQILALIIYYVSLDCTLSKEHSAAAMGNVAKPLLARTVRTILLQHDRALQGLVHLCRQDQGTRSNGKVPSFDSSGVTSVKCLGKKISTRTNDGESVSTNSMDSSTSPTHRHKDRSVHFQKVKTTEIIASSPFNDSVSSLSLGGDCHGQAPSVTPQARVDPTKLGRLNRRRKKLQGTPLDTKLPAVPENNHLQLDDDLEWPEGKIIPPPRKRHRTLQNGDSVASHLSFTSGETCTTSTIESPIDLSEQLSPLFETQVASRVPTSPDNESAEHSAVMSLDRSTNSRIPAHLVPKLDHLRSKAHLSFSPDNKQSFRHANGCSVSQPTEQWVALVCLDSLNRIISGKEGDGPSCLTEEHNDDDDVSPENEESNALLRTNRQLGRSGIIPLLSQCMSDELRWGLNLSEKWETCPSCCYHWNQRITILASLIDGACLFNKANRRSFAESFDPFAFDDNDPYHNNNVPQELIFHILWFLLKQIPSPNDDTDAKNFQATNGHSPGQDIIRSGARLVALRTLTSLTHDNDIAAQQMVALKRFPCQSNCNGVNKAGNVELLSLTSLRGTDILAHLVFHLESTIHHRVDRVVGATGKREDESNRYDSTIFCLSTLANIIEASDVRRVLTEIQVMKTDGEQELWIEWLCQWVVQKTGNIREAILSIGKNNKGGSESEPTLEKDEDDKLVAAGNACVLLACLMTDLGDVSVDPESTAVIRRLILQRMPLDKHGKSTGVTMIINTLKAFCNFYHFSLGELSLAIVGPVKKLIDSLNDWKENSNEMV